MAPGFIAERIERSASSCFGNPVECVKRDEKIKFLAKGERAGIGNLEVKIRVCSSELTAGERDHIARWIDAQDV
jgi:hypothetical protein